MVMLHRVGSEIFNASDRVYIVSIVAALFERTATLSEGVPLVCEGEALEPIAAKQ